jgi:hypothetical protein
MPYFGPAPTEDNNSTDSVYYFDNGTGLGENGVYVQNLSLINAGTVSQFDYAVRTQLLGDSPPPDSIISSENFSILKEKYFPQKPPPPLPGIFMGDSSLYNFTTTKTNTGGGGGGGGDGVDPPRQPTNTQTRIPGTSSELLSMPDLSKAIDDEIKRLTLSIIEDGKDLILSKTVNYKSIDYIPEAEVQIIPPTKRINFIRDQFNNIVDTVQKNINKSKSSYSEYNYAKYLDFFEVQYNNNDGKPNIKFKIDLENFNLDELSVVNLKRKV